MFRENPSLAPHFLEILFHMPVPPHASVGVADSSLDQLIPMEFRADLVLELRDGKGSFVLSIVLEVQRDKEPRKKYSWPVYVTVARAERECETIVLVIAPDADVAAWAAERIELGLVLGHIQPLVLSPAVVPVVTDPAVAEQEAELVILSAVTHGNGPKGPAVLEVALRALGRLDQEHAAVYFQIIYNVLRDPMRRALEALIMDRQTEATKTFPPFVQRLIDNGKLEGERKGKRDALLRFLARAGIALTDEDRARIQACEDAATLDRWVDNVIGAKTIADVLS